MNFPPDITDANVLRAMRTVPRHRFIPPHLVDEAEARIAGALVVQSVVDLLGAGEDRRIVVAAVEAPARDTAQGQVALLQSIADAAVIAEAVVSRGDTGVERFIALIDGALEAVVAIHR